MSESNVKPLAVSEQIDAAVDSILYGLEMLKGILTRPEADEEAFILTTSAGTVVSNLVKDALASLEDQAVEFLKASETGSVQNETTRWYIGTPKKTHQSGSNEALTDAIFTAVGGDMEAFGRALKSGAFKPGEAKSILGEERWATFFTVSKPERLKDGKPQKRLQTIPVAMYERFQLEKVGTEEKGGEDGR